jgi:YidC/Oxa1 family membrane protein insertase
VKDWSEMSDQTRAIIAAALALVVILGWGLLYKPPPPGPQSQLPATAQSSGGTSGAAVAPPSAPQFVAAPPKGGAAAAAVPAVSTNTEQTVTIESDLYRVVLSNRGAVARSWQLIKYTDEHEPPRTLDLIQSDASQAAGGWPFSLQMSDPQLEAAANQGLYVVTQSGAALSGTTTLSAPAEVEFHWSDGQLEVTKRWKFDRSYTAELETSVRRNGQPVTHRVAWRGGFGDVTAFRAAIQTLAFSGSAGNLTTLAIKKLGAPGQPTVPADQPGAFDTVGIEDLYFTAAFLPPAPPAGQPVPADLTLSAWQLIRNVQADGKTTQEILPEVAAGLTTVGPQSFRVFVGPKDLDTLKAVRPPLNGLVQFGWFGFIAEPLFYSLRWLHHYVPNYGWAIVIMTLAINMVLYPLKVKSWRSMQKMQKVAPEIKQIQDRYKKYGMRDPRKQEMNKEVMAVYSREGINPMGSCLPTVIQMPIWFGLYRMLTVTMELRHAPWILWIHDLSGRDPYYILPVVMAVLMYAVTKMTPQTITDPSQQRMMALMPVMFGGMFIIFPVSSGLVLYILTSNFVAMAQQWHLNRTSPLKPPKAKKRQRAALGGDAVPSA